jgi:hypothetical protein
MKKKLIAALAQGQASHIEIDAELGVIRNVALMTTGMAYPANHPEFEVDSVTISQVVDAITKAGSVKSRQTHPELSDPEFQEDFDLIVGRIENARIVGNQARGDFVVSAGASPLQRARIFALATEMPDKIGLSAVLPDLHVVIENGKSVGRLSEVRAVDWVGTPAANPTGLLASSQPSSGVLPAEQNTSTPQKGLMMKYTETQIKYLQSLGLAPDATPEVTDTFVSGLTPEQKASLASHATASAAAPAATPAPAQGAAPAPAANSGANGEAAVLARFNGIQEIATLAGLDAAWVNATFASGKTIEQARSVALSLKTQANKPTVLSGSPTVIVGDNLNKDTIGPAIVDAILLRAGNKPIEVDRKGVAVLSGGNYKPRQVHQRADQFDGLSIVDMGRHLLAAHGFQQAFTMGRNQVANILMSRSKFRQTVSLAGAHSTSDFPSILADVMGKSLRQAYALAPQTWSAWAKKATAPDFKSIKKIQLSAASSLVAIPEGGEYTFGTLTESQETYSLGKYGRGLSFTREMLINDDLDAFDRVPTMMGRAARRMEDRLAYGVISTNANLADGFALFSNDHNNLSTGALTVASMGAAKSLMRKQTALGSTSGDPDYLDLSPRTLLVPEQLDFTARQLVASTVDPSLANSAINPVNALNLQVVSSPYLANTLWYLFADPSDIDTIDVCFLEGEEAPVIEEEDEFDNDTRKMKVRHTVAVKAIDFRGMVRSSGT